jgi:hypothetical protein
MKPDPSPAGGSSEPVVKFCVYGTTRRLPMMSRRAVVMLRAKLFADRSSAGTRTTVLPLTVMLPPMVRPSLSVSEIALVVAGSIGSEN